MGLISYKFDAEQIADGWEQIVTQIVKDGHFVNDERGSLTKEILNVVTTINDFSTRWDFSFGDKLRKYEYLIIILGRDKLRTYSNNSRKSRFRLYLIV